MKKSIFFLGALCALSSAIAQNATSSAQKAAENVTMKRGTFWSSFETQGKFYYLGNWEPGTFNPSFLFLRDENV